MTIFTIPMSNKIDLVYREYLKSVPDYEDINAFFDQDEGQYHIFFPQSDQLSKRLTLTLNPQVGGESKWSSGDFLNTRCAKTLGGVTLLGTPGGIWEQNKIEDVVQYSSEMVVTTPILWQVLSTTSRKVTALSCKQLVKVSFKLKRLMSVVGICLLCNF